MRRTWSIVIFDHEQPDGRTRRAIRRLVIAWNRDESPSFEPLAGSDWHAGFDAATQDRLDRLRPLLAERGIKYHFSWRDLLEDEDYASADFVGLFGAAPRDAISFLRNDPTAFVPDSPCQLCGGSMGQGGMLQAEPLVIDSALLDQGLDDLPQPGPGGWDMITLPTGRCLVSRRLVTVLADHRVSGYRTRPVIDAATGEPSQRLVQIVADRAILVPCPAHTKVDVGPFCPNCGTGWGVLDGYFRIRDDWISDDEVLARRPAKDSTFYVSKRVYDLLSSLAPNGINRHDLLLVCGHQGRFVADHR